MIEFKKLILFGSLLAICVFSAPFDEDDFELNDEQIRAYTSTTRASQSMSEPLKSKYKWPITTAEPHQIIVPIVIQEKDYSKCGTVSSSELRSLICFNLFRSKRCFG